MNCIQCQKELAPGASVASISGSIMGDEVTDSYFLCPACDVYTKVSWWDDFTGEESSNTSGPVTRPEGDERVALMRRCSTPWDKKCRCEAHVAYFRGALD